MIPIVPLILAGKRNNDQLSIHCQVANKAFIDILDKSMIEWVIQAIQSSSIFQSKILMTVNEDQYSIFQDKFSKKYPELIIIPVKECCSASKAIIHALSLLQENESLLITTADHPLLTKEMINNFTFSCVLNKAEIGIGVVDGKKYYSPYIHNKRTWHKLNTNISLSGANLFYFSLDQTNKEELQSKLIALENARKTPLKFAAVMAQKHNLHFLLKILLRSTTIEECEAFASSFFNLHLKLICLPYWQACIDVDKLEDLILVKQILSTQIPTNS